MKYNSDDFLYASARVRAMEASDIYGDKLLRLADSKSEEETYHLFAEYGLRTDGASVEEAIEERLKDALEVAERSVKDGGFLKIFRYVYDCHNIKSCIKCEIRRRDPLPMLADLGTAPAAGLAELIAKRETKGLPANMGRAVAAAFEEYSKSGDPQMIDVTVDRACFADMKNEADLWGSQPISDAVDCRADMANLTEAVRIIRAHDSEPGASRFRRTCVDRAGKLPQSFFTDSFGRDDAEKHLFSKLACSEYSSLAQRPEADQTGLSELEKLCDERLYELAAGTRTVLCGPEVIYSYMILKEREAKNLRIIASGKRAGLSPEHIRKRLRA